MKYVFMFPGQNSRYPGMLDRLRASTPVADRILREASDVLGRNLPDHYREDNPEIFARNRDVQIGVFLANFIFARVLEDEGIQSDASVGLSLGEYNHLVEIGVLNLSSALRLLEARGTAYDAAPFGKMISVFPCQEDQVQEALAIGRSIGRVDISIHLGKKHFVLGGEEAGVNASVAWLEAEAFAQSSVIDSRLPMHAAVFKPAADAFRSALEISDWQCMRAPYLPNVDGRFADSASPDDFVDKLYRHVFSTVQWQRSIDLMIQRFPDATYIEVGPKAVLHNQVSREYRTLKTQHTDKESCWQTSKA
jgi:[acyl-carrier-protein] S-malonyltransferase